MGGYGRSSVADCKGAAPPAAAVVAVSAGATETQDDSIAPAATARAPDERSGARLIFAQYDYKALAIDGSALDTGVKLTLGTRNRNIAFVPMIGRDANGRLVRLESRDSAGGRDVLSVLGQFESDDSIKAEASGAADGAMKTAGGGGDGSAPRARGISSGLEKFFSTGAAARILSEGFKAKLCEEYAVSSAARQAPLQTSPSGGNQKTAAPTVQPATLTAPEATR
jgi:hypothetical protein